MVASKTWFIVYYCSFSCESEEERWRRGVTFFISSPTFGTVVTPISSIIELGADVLVRKLLLCDDNFFGTNFLRTLSLESTESAKLSVLVFPPWTADMRIHEVASDRPWTKWRSRYSVTKIVTTEFLTAACSSIVVLLFYYELLLPAFHALTRISSQLRLGCSVCHTARDSVLPRLFFLSRSCIVPFIPILHTHAHLSSEARKAAFPFSPSSKSIASLPSVTLLWCLSPLSSVVNSHFH